MSVIFPRDKQVILVTAADLAPQALDLLDGHEVIFAGKTPQPADIAALARRHNPVAIIVRYGGVTAEVMDLAPALKVISKHGSGTDTIDKVAAKARNIEVRAAVGVNAAAVAEHALALLLACAKAVPNLNARMHGGFWDKATHKSVELAGRTMGLVGIGAIGARFARMAKALDMRVIGYDPYATNVPSDVELLDLETLWRSSDAISFHCPLTEDNRNLLNREGLASCKPGVIVVNTARGGLIDESALLDAVRSGHVACAGLDSFAIEPMIAGHPFQGEERIILSPHIGGVSADAYVKMGVAAAENVLAVLRA
ncbi:NAD(P)-dependent oxidoreductase [Polaromonas sp.]|uniref:NAD(P)-dependent oxidoreductase n=1 Tax=Polaromonas sp. TaxID=1869339 RepID=UPI0032644DB1